MMAAPGFMVSVSTFFSSIPRTLDACTRSRRGISRLISLVFHCSCIIFPKERAARNSEKVNPSTEIQNLEMERAKKAADLPYTSQALVGFESLNLQKQDDRGVI